MTTLHTPRLIIRPLTEADLPALVAYSNDPKVEKIERVTARYLYGAVSPT